MTRLLALPLVAALLWPPAAQAEEVPPLSTHLDYHWVSWILRGTSPDGPRIAVKAPQGWDFRRTKDGQGRFHDPTRTFQLVVADPLQDPGMRSQIEMQVESVEDSQDYHLITRTVQTDEKAGAATGTLKYSFTYGGIARLVTWKYEGYLADGTSGPPRTAYFVQVAGRPQDDAGLAALLHEADRTVSEGD